MPRKPSESKQKVFKIIEIISAKKAESITVLDVRRVCNFCNYFVICSADSGRQVRAIYEEVIKTCKKNNIKIQHWEDDELSRWILVDFFDVILHIFISEARKFYDLEHLWNTAKKVKLHL